MKIKSKIVALAVAGAMVAAAFGGAQAAQAAPIPTPVGGPTPTITITPTSGNAFTDTYFLNSIAVNVGAPVGFRAISSTVVFQGGVNMGSVSTVRTPTTPTTYGTFGLDGNPSFADRTISPPNPYVSNTLLNATTVPLVTGAFELRNYYFALSTSVNYVTDAYVSLAMTYDAVTGAWSVVVPVAPAIATTVSLSASAAASTVSLGATVKLPDTTTATAAAGNVVFKEGVTTVATVPVASGLASASLTGVANGAHSYTAQFVPSNTVYSTSTSAVSTVQVGGIQATSNITVTIPANVGTLTLTGVSASVPLGTAVLNTASNTLDASGTLNAVVTDTRQLDAAAWSLTGQVGDFTAGTKVLSGKYLGWTPAVAAGSIGTAGAIVLPAPTSLNGVKDISQMSLGAPSAAGSVTNASALLQLKAPANTPSGAYSATLTLTLI